MANEEVQGMTLKLTEEDIRQDCAAMKIPYTALLSVAARLKQQQTTSSIKDVLYMMMLAKSKGLNPIDDNYSLIPRPGGQGFSLTFNKSAALHVINKHPKVKPGAILRRFVVTGKGERIDLHEHPEKAPGRWKLGDIDWDLTAICEIESASGGVLRGSAKFGNCFAAGNDGNPKFLWLKNPVDMTMKQAYKDLANVELDGALPDDEEREAAELAEANANAPRSLPAASMEDQYPVNTFIAASEPTGEPGATISVIDVSGIIAKAAQLGINADQIVAAFKNEEKNGVTLEVFEAGLQKEIDSRAAKASTARTPRRAAKSEPATAEAPKAEVTKPEPAPRAKKEPKPVFRVTGTVDAIKELTKELRPKREGDPPGKQPYLIISVNRMDMTVWHKSFFDGMYEAHESNPPKRVKIGYVVSTTKDGQEFAEVEEFEIIEEAVPQQETEPAGIIHEEEDVPQDGPESPQAVEDESPAPSGTGLLFNF